MEQGSIPWRPTMRGSVTVTRGVHNPETSNASGGASPPSAPKVPLSGDKFFASESFISRKCAIRSQSRSMGRWQIGLRTVLIKRLR